MVTSVSHTLQPSDPGEWKSLIHFLRSVSQSSLFNMYVKSSYADFCKSAVVCVFSRTLFN